MKCFFAGRPRAFQYCTMKRTAASTASEPPSVRYARVSEGGVNLDEFGSEANGGLARESEVSGGVGQLAHLVGRGFDDTFLAIADVHAPKSRERVEQFAPVHVGEP